MKTKTLCILSGLLFLIIFSFPLLAQPLPYYSPPAPVIQPKITPIIRPTITPRIPIPPSATPGTPSGPATPTEPPAPTTPPPATLTCEGVSPINIDAGSILTAVQKTTLLQRTLNDLSSHDAGDAYKFCFNITNGPLKITSEITINAADKPKLVSNLNIMRDNDSSTSRTVNLLSVASTATSTSSVTLINSDIQGIGAEDEGPCLVLRGSRHVVKHSNIHHCDVGIQIEGSRMQVGPETEVSIDSERNEIHDNNIGINWMDLPAPTVDNKFAYNIIANNFADSIIIEEDPFELIPDITFTLPEVAGVLNCALVGESVSSWLHFENIPDRSKVIIYRSQPRMSEINEYLTTCIVDGEGKCLITSLHGIDLPDRECSREVYISTLIDGASSTSMLSMPGKLAGPPVVALAGGTTPVDITSPGGDMARSEEPEVTEGGNNMTAAATAVEGSGATSVVSTGPGSGGCGGGGGATIVPPSGRTVASGLTLWWLIFTAPAVLIAVRIKKRK